MTNRSQFIRGGLVVALIIGLSIPAIGAFAKTKRAKKAKVANITLVGTADVVTGKRGKISALSLRDAEGTTHKIMLTSAAKKVAKTMAGKSVALTGRVVHVKSKTGKVAWFRIKSFKPGAELPAPKKPAPSEDDEADESDE